MTDQAAPHESAGRPAQDVNQRVTLRGFVKRYWFEFTAVLLLALGIFLIVEKLQIKLAVYNFLASSFNSTMATAKSVIRSVSAFLSEVETSDLVGVALVFIAFCMIAHKVRERAIRRHPDMDHLEGCPRCSQAIRRVQRGILEHMTGVLLQVQVRCYECTKCSFYAAAWRSRFDKSEVFEPDSAHRRRRAKRGNKSRAAQPS